MVKFSLPIKIIVRHTCNTIWGGGVQVPNAKWFSPKFNLGQHKPGSHKFKEGKKYKQLHTYALHEP